MNLMTAMGNTKNNLVFRLRLIQRKGTIKKQMDHRELCSDEGIQNMSYG